MPSPSRRPEQGDIWLADLAPPVGHEQAGPPRPVLVVSGSIMNRAPYDLAWIVSLSTRLRGLPGHIRLPAADSGLRADSEILCEHLRSISHQRFRSPAPLTRVRPEVLRQVQSQIFELMEP